MLAWKNTKPALSQTSHMLFLLLECSRSTPQPQFPHALCLGYTRLFWPILRPHFWPLIHSENTSCHCLAVGPGVTHLASQSLWNPLLACSHFSECCEMPALTCDGGTHHSSEEELVFFQMLHYRLSLPLEWELRASSFSSPRVQHIAWHLASTLYILLTNVEGIMIINMFWALTLCHALLDSTKASNLISVTTWVGVWRTGITIIPF